MSSHPRPTFSLPSEDARATSLLYPKPQPNRTHRSSSLATPPQPHPPPYPLPSTSPSIPSSLEPLPPPGTSFSSRHKTPPPRSNTNDTVPVVLCVEDGYSLGSIDTWV